METYNMDLLQALVNYTNENSDMGLNNWQYVAKTFCYYGRHLKIHWKEWFSELQIGNCNETTFNFHMLPSKTLVSRNEKSASSYNRNNKTLTILAWSNEAQTQPCKEYT